MSFDSVARADSTNNGQLSGQEAAAVGAFNTIRQQSNQLFNFQPTSGLLGCSVANQQPQYKAPSRQLEL